MRLAELQLPQGHTQLQPPRIRLKSLTLGSAPLVEGKRQPEGMGPVHPGCDGGSANPLLETKTEPIFREGQREPGKNLALCGLGAPGRRDTDILFLPLLSSYLIRAKEKVQI